MHYTRTAVACGLLFASTGALADQWYVAGNLGVTSQGDQTITIGGSDFIGIGEASFDQGFNGGGAFGYIFSERWRLEGDIQYVTTPIDVADVPGLGEFTSGDFSSLGLGINGYFQFPLLNEFTTAYVGAGVTWLQEVDIDFADMNGESSYSTDDIAYQFIVGMRFDVDDRWYGMADVRYLTASDLSLEGEAGAPGTITADYEPLTLTFGIGYRF